VKERLSYVSHVLTLAAAFILFIGVNTASAQVGKITGVVTDAQTGEALSGVQVYLEGTGRGALTGENGRYFLVNVPVGTYTVVAEFLGYATFRIENVFLRIDQTRTIDFAMTPQAIAVEEIRVEAERVPLIDVTSTGSQNTITAEQITALPVNNVEEALALQQGGEQLHLRKPGALDHARGRGPDRLHPRRLPGVVRQRAVGDPEHRDQGGFGDEPAGRDQLPHR
jgi:hypothetical protein